MKTLRILFLVLLCFLFSNANAKEDSVKIKLYEVINSTDAKVGIAVKNFETDEIILINGDVCFPMQSVFKFPLAMSILNLVDEGKYSLEQEIYISKSDLLPDTYSPLRDKYPEGNIKIPLSEILKYTVSLSDNNGCDILFRLLGGVEKADSYIKSLGINGLNIIANEEEMHKDWILQYINCSSPQAMLNLLENFFQRKNLSKENSDFLWKIMTETSTGPKRLKGLLPEGTVVAHKTGTSGANEEGLNAATNDVGIITLPNGMHYAIVVFVSDSKKEIDFLENVMAKISKIIWDYFCQKL